MFYDIGDLHADQMRWIHKVEPRLQSGDTLLVNGDFGIGFWCGRIWSEETFFDHIAEQPFTLLFIDGNHENFQKLNRYPVEEWCGGKVHKIRPNLIHLMRGEIYTIQGMTFFTFGGGFSLDVNRRTEGWDWWPEEMPSREEYENAMQNLNRVGNKVDYIITHTAPSETVAYLSTMGLGIKKYAEEELELTTFLDQIQQKVQYRHWYFGHFHVDVDLWRNQTAVLQKMHVLNSLTI